MKERTYVAIDLKSFYASVECRERGLDPLDTNLVVADESRTDKTICLAVTPSLKSFHIPGRARLFEVREKVGEVNSERKRRLKGKDFSGSSFLASELNKNPSLKLDFIAAKPRMALYMKYSTDIYSIYMKYISPEDMIVYSVDEVFMDVTDYLGIYGLSPRELARKMILEVLKQTGITATAGIGTNLYLCKIAMDIKAKHIPADENGVRIADLDEMSYRRELWTHVPMTDFWRLGKGYEKKLKAFGMNTMGDVARCSLENEDLLYRLFGKNAELLIDHAWGWEPCTIKDIKAYQPENNSISSGQVLHCPYEAKNAGLIVKEMADALSLELVEKGLVTDQIVISVGYDVENLLDSKRRKAYKGEVVTDRYGRNVPKHAHGTWNLGVYTSSTQMILQAVSRLYDRIINPDLLVRRMNVVANHVIREDSIPEKEETFEQLDLFTDYQKQEEERIRKKAQEDKERRLQKTAIEIKKKYGKNALLRGMNFEEGATMRDRNGQIGGHKA